jgi:hypothetical protein
MFCDNKSLIKRISERRSTRITVNQHNYTDIDLELHIIAEIRALQEEKFGVSNRYVQSNKKQMSRNAILPLEKQMHMIADSLCKRAQECQNQNIYYKLPANEVNFVLNNHTINENVAKATTIAYHSISLKKYMKGKYKWMNQQINKIWWKPHHKSMMKLESNDLVRIQKFIFNYLPTNKRKNKHQQSNTNMCESCDNNIETENHIFRRQSARRHDIEEKWIEELQRYLSEPHTSMDVRESIIMCMTIWLNNEHIPAINTFPVIMRTTIQEQDQVGWDHFIPGRMVTSWSMIINDNIHQKEIKHINAEQWATDKCRTTGDRCTKYKLETHTFTMESKKYRNNRRHRNQTERKKEENND